MDENGRIEFIATITKDISLLKNLEMDLRDSLRAVATPTLVVVGKNDHGTPVSAAELIHKGIAFSELRILSAAAHFCNVEQKDLFNGTLLDFIRRNEG